MRKAETKAKPPNERNAQKPISKAPERENPRPHDMTDSKNDAKNDPTNTTTGESTLEQKTDEKIAENTANGSKPAAKTQKTTKSAGQSSKKSSVKTAAKTSSAAKTSKPKKAAASSKTAEKTAKTKTTSKAKTSAKTAETQPKKPTAPENHLGAALAAQFSSICEAADPAADTEAAAPADKAQPDAAGALEHAPLPVADAAEAEPAAPEMMDAPAAPQTPDASPDQPATPAAEFSDNPLPPDSKTDNQATPAVAEEEWTAAIQSNDESTAVSAEPSGVDPIDPAAVAAESPMRIVGRASPFPKNAQGIVLMGRNRTTELGAAIGAVMGEAAGETMGRGDETTIEPNVGEKPVPMPEVIELTGSRKPVTQKAKRQRIPEAETLASAQLEADLADAERLATRAGRAETAQLLAKKRDEAVTAALEAAAAKSIEAALASSIHTPLEEKAAEDQIVQNIQAAQRLDAAILPSAESPDAPWYLQGIEAIDAHLALLEAAGLDAKPTAEPPIPGLFCPMAAAALAEALEGLLKKCAELDAEMRASPAPERLALAATAARKALVHSLERFADLSKAHAENAELLLARIREEGLLGVDLRKERLQTLESIQAPLRRSLSSSRDPAPADLFARLQGELRRLLPFEAAKKPAADPTARSQKPDSPRGRRPVKTSRKTAGLVGSLLAAALAGAIAGGLAAWAAPMFLTQDANVSASPASRLSSFADAVAAEAFGLLAEPVRADAEAIFAKAARVRLAETDPKTGAASPKALLLTREGIERAIALWETGSRRVVLNWPDRHRPTSPFRPIGRILTAKTSGADEAELPDVTELLLAAIPGLSVDDAVVNARIAERWGLPRVR